MSGKEVIIAIDPGTKKCGYAVVESNKNVLRREVIPIEELMIHVKENVDTYNIERFIVGNGTNCKEIEKKLKKHFLQLEIVFIEENFSTLEARKKYFKAYPPKGIFKLIPLSLRVPPCHYDDFVAVLLAEKYFSQIENNR